MGSRFHTGEPICPLILVSAVDDEARAGDHLRLMSIDLRRIRAARPPRRMSSLRSFTPLTLAVLSSCAVYDPSLLDTHAGVTVSSGGSDDTAGAMTTGANGGRSNEGSAGSGESTAMTGGASQGGRGSGAGSSVGGGGASNGGAGNGGAGNGNGGRAGNGGTGSTGSGGSGSAGSGIAGSGSGSGAGATSGGSAGAGGAPINPCDRSQWKATASESSVNPSNPPALAIDGVPSTRWSTGATQVGGEWFLLDLGARAAHLTQLVLDSSGSPDDQPLKYKLEVSDDGTSYALVCTGTGAPITVIKFVDTPARYIRITQTGSDPDANWWSIQELTLTCSPN
jgi:F5/8 type C domain-containing protein